MAKRLEDQHQHRAEIRAMAERLKSIPVLPPKDVKSRVQKGVSDERRN